MNRMNETNDVNKKSLAFRTFRVNELLKENIENKLCLLRMVVDGIDNKTFSSGLLE